MPRLILALLLMLAPSAALAQSAQCRMPATLPRPKAEGPTAKEPKRVLPLHAGDQLDAAILFDRAGSRQPAMRRA